MNNNNKDIENIAVLSLGIIYGNLQYLENKKLKYKTNMKCKDRNTISYEISFLISSNNKL